MSDCTRTEEQLVDFLDGTLSRAEHAAIESHAAHCAACGTTLRESRSILTAYRSIPDEDAGVAVASRVRAAALPHGTSQRARRPPWILAACAAAVLLAALASVFWFERGASPERLQLLVREAEAQADAGRSEGALATYERALLLAGEDSNAPEILRRIAELHVAHGDFVQALDRLGQVVSKHPDYAGLESVLLLRGQALEGLGRREEALELYRLVASEFPVNRSEALRKIAELEYAGQIDPGDLESLEALGYGGD